MAESIVQVTEGSGKKLHTFARVIGANTVEDEAVINGEQYLASYSFNAGPAIITLNAHCLQIMAGASLIVRIRRIEILPGTAATAALRGGWGIYRLTTAGTGGGVITPSKLDPADAASGATAMTLPTVKGTEGVLVTVLTDNVWQTMPTSGTIGPKCVVDFDRPRSKPLIIPAGTANGIAIKNLVAVAAADININVIFDESNF
jgi:hypothetical protein